MIRRLFVFHETFGSDGGEPLVDLLRDRAASGGPVVLDASYPATPETVLPTGRETSSLVVVETNRLYDSDQLQRVRERFTSKGVAGVALTRTERVGDWGTFYRLLDFVRAMTGKPVVYIVRDGTVWEVRGSVVEKLEKD